MTQRAYVEQLAEVIAGAVRREREAQGMSAQQLADACARVGLPIQRSVIANLENGRRTTVSVAEVLVFAEALGVPPVALIAPVGREKVMPVLPGVDAEPYAAAQWVSGLMAGPWSGRSRYYKRNPLEQTRKLYQFLEWLMEEEEELRHLRSQRPEREEALERALQAQLRVQEELEAAMNQRDGEKDFEFMGHLRRRLLRLAKEANEVQKELNAVPAAEAEIAEIEGLIRDTAKGFHEEGWVLPDFGPYGHLLSPPEAKGPAVVRHRRRARKE